jgi:hypothetical protein
LVVSGPTTVPVSGVQPTGLPGSLTVIDGTTELVIPGPTTIPVNPNFSVSGRTTVIDGTTMVVIDGATTVPIKPTGASTTGSSGTSSGGSLTASATISPASKSQAAPPAQTSKESGARSGYIITTWVLVGVLILEAAC